MEARFNQTGEGRKRMVEAVAEILGERAIYMGMPTAAYRVGEFLVSKDGTLIWPNGYNPIVVECVIDGLARRGFGYDDYVVPEQARVIVENLTAMVEAHDADNADQTTETVSIEAEAAAYAEREIRRMKLEAQNVPDYSNRGPYGGDPIDCYDEPDSAEMNTMTISIPRNNLTPEALVRLIKLVDSKRTLLQEALGAQTLDIQEDTMDSDEEIISFPWFRFTDDADTVRAYTELVSKLCEMARSAKRVLGKERTAPNKKFALRIFLIRLGFIGDEHRTSRRILLQNLEGCSAWRNGPPAKTKAESEVDAQ